MKNIEAYIRDVYYRRLYLDKDTIPQMNEKIKIKLNNLDNSINDIVQNEETKEILKEKNKLIEKIIQKANLNNYIKDFVLKVNEKSKETSSIHKNILLIGKRGVGKSTLINSFLKIDKALTGIGESITQKFESYISDPDCSIRLIDSKGMVENCVQSLDGIKEYIHQKLLSNNKDEYIHCIWYCLEGSRYSEEDKNAIKSLLSFYEDDCLPVIIVYTKAINKQIAKEYLDKITLFLGKDNEKISYVPILAKDFIINANVDITIPSFGLDELKKMTLMRMSKAINSSYYQSIKERIICLYKNNIDKKYEKIKNKINNMINLTQIHTISLLNFETIFFEILNLIFFNDNAEHNIENIVNNIFFYDNNNVNNELIEIKPINDENQNLINNTDNNLIEKSECLYKIFLKRISRSLIDAFESKVYNLYEEIIISFGVYDPNIKGKIYKKISAEFRAYNKLEKEVNLEEDNKAFINSLKNQYYNFDFEENNDINNIQNEDEENNNDNLINDEDNYLSNRNNLQTKSKKYKFSNNDILKIKEIEQKAIIQSLKYFSQEMLVYIKNYLNSDICLNYLKNVINDKIAEIKDNIN